MNQGSTQRIVFLPRGLGLTSLLAKMGAPNLWIRSDDPDFYD